MYEKTVSDISKSLRAMAKRVRRAEAQLSRRRGVPVGTSADRENNPQSQLWWDTDLDAFMANVGNGWEPVKDVRTGTTGQRMAYTAVNAGEFWWDTSEERLYAWDGNKWESTDVAEAGTTTERNASSPEHGQWWLDTDDGFTYVYDGAEWKAPTSSRYIEPFLLPANLYGLFTFIPYRQAPVWPILVSSVELSNLMDYPGDVWHTGSYGDYSMMPHNSPGYGDNGHVPYIDLEASSSQYCTTKNYRTTGDLTILAWVSPNAASGTTSIIDKWYEDSDNRCYKLTMSNGDTFRFYVSQNGVADLRNPYAQTNDIPSNEFVGWNFIAARFSAGHSPGIFHNGTWTSPLLRPWQIPASIHDYDNDIAFGKSNVASPVYFDGQISIVAICKYVISDELIDYIYQSTKSSYIPQPEPEQSDSISVGEYAFVALGDISTPKPDSTEHISVSEFIDMFGLTNPSASENISVSEFIDMFGLTNPSASDSVIVSESINVYYPQPDTRAVIASDSTAISESVNAELVDAVPLSVNVSDNVSVSENVDVDGGVNVTTSDSTSIGEYVHTSGDLPSSNLKINYLLTDDEYFSANYWSRIYPYWSTARVEPDYVSVSDNVAVTENISVGGIVIAANISDNISVSESVDASAPIVLEIDVSDGVGVSENTGVYYPELGALGLSVSDNTTVTESTDVEHIPNPESSDSIVVNESTNAVVPDVDAMEASTSDSIITSENVDVALYLPPSYLMTDNGYFNANYWPRIYLYWAKAP